MEAAGHVRAGDDVEQRVVVAQPPEPEALAEIGVQVDDGRRAGHRRSLGTARYRRPVARVAVVGAGLGGLAAAARLAAARARGHRA